MSFYSALTIGLLAVLALAVVAFVIPGILLVAGVAAVALIVWLACTAYLRSREAGGHSAVEERRDDARRRSGV